MSSRQARYASLVRCLRLAAWLQGRRYRPAVGVMARELGVSGRTVRRYVAALEEAHWPMPEEKRDDSFSLETSKMSIRGGSIAWSNVRFR